MGNKISIRAIMGEGSLLCNRRGVVPEALRIQHFAPLGHFENSQCLIGCVEMIWIKIRDHSSSKELMNP